MTKWGKFELTNTEGFKQIKKNVLAICRKLNRSLNMKIGLHFTMADYLIALEELHVKPKKNSIAETNLVEEWDYEKNGDLKPSFFTTGSHAEVYWKCKKKGHSWRAVIYSRKHSGCPYCKNQKVFPKDSITELESWILLIWDYKMNKRQPHSLPVGSSTRVYLLPCQHGHKARSDKLCRIISDKGECKDCRKMPKSIAVRHSFILMEWDFNKNIGKDPFLINGHSKIRVNLICSCCGESYEVIVRNRIRRKVESSKCPDCDKRTGGVNVS